MELMKASFDGTFPDFPFPNPESGLSRIHVVTFHLFNSFNSASYVLRNSQCKLRVNKLPFGSSVSLLRGFTRMPSIRKVG
jgi:hypothetical protein